AVSILPWPEIITTGTSGCSRLTASSSCRPSSLEPCSQMSRKTRFGRCDAIAAMASSLLRAVRAPYPSSCRMPATRSRMSASSSTMRISAGMMLLAHRWLLAAGRGIAVARGGKAHAHPGAALAGNFIGGDAQLDRAAVLLDDAADDREPKPGALLARGHVRLEQTAAVFLRQADAVVDDVDDDVAAVARGDDPDRTLAELGRRHGGDRLARVLDDVGQRLRDQPPVELRAHRVFRHLRLDVDVGVADTHQEHGLAHGVGDVFRRDLGL